MAKLLSIKLNSAYFRKYHTKLPKVYIILLSKEDSPYGFDNADCYEYKVTPIITELGVVVPDNLIVWKHLELDKFARKHSKGEIQLIDGKLPIKEQWLYFLSKCDTEIEIPNDVDDTIKDAFKMMNQSKLNREQMQTYVTWTHKEKDETLKLTEEKIKGEISKIKALMKYEISQEKMIHDLKFLTHKNVINNIKDNLAYIRAHLEDTDDNICDELDLVNKLLGFI